MKNLIPLMTLAIVFLLGCAKEETTTAALISDDKNADASSAWVLNTYSESPEWEHVTKDELRSSASTGLTTRSNSAHTHGNYTGANGNLVITFSGTENNGGSHGSADFQQWRAGGYAHVILETDCVYVDGDEAVYGGLITEVIENSIPSPPPPPGCPGAPYCPPCNPLDLGTYVYFKVVDNGEGINAPIDQYYGIIFGSCNGFPCDTGLPWFLGGVHDVENEGDKIKVN